LRELVNVSCTAVSAFDAKTFLRFLFSNKNGFSTFKKIDDVIDPPFPVKRVKVLAMHAYGKSVFSVPAPQQHMRS